MGLFHVSIRLHIYVLLIICLMSVCNAFTPEDNYLIDCGSLTNTTIGSRIFLADLSISSSLSTSKTIFATTTSNLVSSFDSSVLYQTARVFTGPSSYSFPIQRHGRHFIRLYFFPFVYQSYNLTAANFAVTTQDFVLLSHAEFQNGLSAFVKEYSVNVTSDALILSFKPLGDNSIAFVNAIEVVSVPGDLIGSTAQTVNPAGKYDGELSAQSFETIYRINMGGLKVSRAEDTLWRTWDDDQRFLRDKNFARSVNFSGTINYVQGGATQDTAPDLVYRTAAQLAVSNTSNALFNMTWEFNVDPNPVYLIRLHFCDIVSKALNLLYFNVYINGGLAVQDLDLSTLMISTLAAPYFVDFVASGTDGSGKVRVSVGPSTTVVNILPDAILNGLEIMKMNSSVGSFDGQNSILSHSGSKSKLAVILGSVLGAVLIVILAVILYLVFRKRKMNEKHHSKTWLPFSVHGGTSHGSGSSKGTALGSGQNASHGLQFSFTILQEATKNFDETWVIGVGGFGKVYKGLLKDGTKVAVKRGNPKSQQGLNEFRTEIELLSRLRHRHLVSLIGYCDEFNEMILVYEYMEKGTLKSHLYGSGLPHLSWKQRLEICIGSAKGLHYLHTGSAKAIIHRDVKSANILLDETLLAKVADFGLSKTGPELDQTHVSTAVKGSFGYLDPEYFRRQQLTEKSDVYSFGVVLLEVLCARPVIDPTLPREMVNLAEWALKRLKKGELEQIVDPHLAGAIRPDSLRKFGETAEKCLADYGVERPTMGDVLWNLDYALQLQEAISGDLEVDSINQIAGLSPQVQNAAFESVALDGFTSTSANDSDVSMNRVFSQLINSEGR